MGDLIAHELVSIEIGRITGLIFVSISQVIGCEDHLQNDIDCVERRVKHYSNSN